MVKSEDFLPAASGLDGIEWTEDTPKLILSYGDAAAERHSALTGAFLKDVRAARVIRTEGENGEKLLRRLITADVAKHATGDCLLASMLNASGGVMQEVAVIAHMQQLSGVVLGLFLGQLPPRVGQAQGKQVQHAQLHHIGLGGGHGDLRPGVGVQHIVGGPGDGAAHHVLTP